MKTPAGQMNVIDLMLDMEGHIRTTNANGRTLP